MNIILLGMPGAGKGTVSEWLQEQKKYCHVSTGDLLRREVQAESELGKTIQNIMNEGKLVSDEIMIDIIKQYITEKQNAPGVIFDGFPRTIAQAEGLAKIVTIDMVVFLQADEELVVKRLLNRTSEDGSKRQDDNEETIRKRIKVFYENTNALIDYYDREGILATVDGALSIDAVREEVGKLLT